MLQSKPAAAPGLLHTHYLFPFGVLLSLLTSAWLGGCTPTLKMYPGPERPKESVATLEVSRPVFLVSINGQTADVTGRRFPGSGAVLHVLPGPQVILAEYFECFTGFCGRPEAESRLRGEAQELRAVLEADCRYRVVGHVFSPMPIKDGGVYDWIVELRPVE